MSALFIATPKVRHLATWTADEPDTTKHARHWAPESGRAICGAVYRRNESTLFGAHDLDNRASWSPEFNARMDDAMRRPVCRRCLATLAALTDLADRSTQP